MRLEHQALHDGLTGLPNRALFLDRLTHALTRQRGRGGEDGSKDVAVLFMDLDNFKYVNDSLGHDAGDELLAKAARRLEGCVRPEDTVARLGDDEFAVLLESLGSERAREVAARIGEALRAPFLLGGEEARVGASVGVACALPGEKDAAELLGEADREMYQAKERGRGHGGARRRED